MRGRRGQSSSSVSQEQTRMALRKQLLQDVSDVPSGSQQVDENTQEDDALDDGDDNDELSSTLLSPALREKRKRETENKSKEMTEEEMMDMALRLSEQEASVTALRVQQEEEAMTKAIQESMFNQTQPAQSRRLLTDAEASLGIFSHRKLLYANGKKASASVNQGAAEDVCTPEAGLNPGAKGTGDESNNRLKKRKRKEGSPLLEMPDLSQVQKISSQASPCSLEGLSVPLDSPQSCDSTQIDDCQLLKSPVFPSADCRAKVHVPRLSQDLLETCRTSGFVFCSSQDSWASPRKSQSAQASSPAFAKSPKRSNNLTLCESPVSLEADQGDDVETDPSSEYFKSPVFGRNAQHESSPSACKPQDGVCNSGFMFSSQESSTSSVKSTSGQPKSPVFPKSPGLPKNLPSPEKPATCRSPVFSETVGGRCTSPVFSRLGRLRKIKPVEQKHAASPSAAELMGSDSDGNLTTTGAPTQSLRQDSKTDHNQDAGFNKSSTSDDVEDEPNATSKDCSVETELTSDMTLLWSDDDVTPVGSPSPVFPEERPVYRADGEDASLNHVSAASPGMNCRPSTSTSTSTSRQQPSTAERGPQPISSQGEVSGAPAGGPTVHYYWGVPFCPRGVDPDEYTQVILGHMEVYEKSLKQAQRCLLRKAEWGEAVLPQPEKSPSPESPAESSQQLVPRRRGLRLRRKNVCDAADTLSAEAEEDEEHNKDEEEERASKEGEEEKKKKKEGEEGQADTDDCEVCPETQLSDNDDDKTQDLMMPPNAAAERGFQFDGKKSPEPLEVEMILQVDSPAREELQEEEEEEEMEVDAAVDRKTKGSILVSCSDAGGQHVGEERTEEDGGDPDVEEITDRGLQRSMSSELKPAALSQNSEAKVDCPMCQGSYPVTEIERHAAYCDGEVAIVEERRPDKGCLQVSMKPRRKRTRRAEAAAEVTYEPSNTGNGNQEKCYICQKVVPLRDYNRHTELCIQRQASKTAAKGNLLSALEQTESRDSEAGPSGSKLHSGDVIDLRDDDDDDDEEEGSVSAVRISNSPIRAFTPISEATGCLIDFKTQQRAKTLRQRRR